jgi:hypothetical protein
MLLLEKPYVSETLIRTAVEKKYPVLRNAMSEQLAAAGHALNLYNDEDFAAAYKQRQRLYCMSENGLGWISQHIDDPALLEKINLLKNKAAFRRICRTLYPDYFFEEVSVSELDKVDANTLPFPVVLKPSVGFLSVGVYMVENREDWKNAVADIHQQFAKASAQFPEYVVGTSHFLMEKMIKGEEYAVDAYFDEEGSPVILNIYHHRFASATDTSDRLYCSSKALFDRYGQPFTDFLKATNQVIRLRNFPMHIEFRIENGRAIPIEINPLRFAGFCLNELQTHISGLHPVTAYLENLHISKEEMWKGRETDTYSFLVLEKPAGCPKNALFNVSKFEADFSDVLEIREVKGVEVGVAATAFTRTDTAHANELEALLHLDMRDYMKVAE